MTEARPLHLVCPPGPLRDRVASTLSPVAPRSFDGVDGFRDAEPEPGVVLLVEEALGGEAVLAAVRHLARGRGEWTPVLVREDEGELTARTLSAGYPRPLPEVVVAAADGPPGDGGSLLELRGVLRDISRARHDINNPLTSALAETQLLLMDVPEGEVRDSLETILQQLRRIRDMVGATVHLRPLE